MAKETGNRSESQAERDKRLQEIILLIALRSEGDEPFGSVKLNKLLFYADFLSYVRFGESITGQEYQALPQGPAPRRLLPVIEKMKRQEVLAIREHDYYGRNQQRPLALDTPDTTEFVYEQIELVERVVKHFWGKNATEMSLESHQFVGWKLAKKGETIPYSVALIGSRKPTLAERKRGLDLEEIAQECLAKSEAA